MNINLSIVIPAYKENKNIKNLINLIYKEINISLKNFEVIIVDDNSNDGIKDTCAKFKKKFSNLNLFVRKKSKRDLAKSCIDGFNLSKFKNILVMDADLQHHPKYINKMIAEFTKHDLDMLVACRKFENKSKVGVSYLRYILSRFIIFLFNFFLGFRTKDPMSGFFIFKKKIFYSNKDRLFARGYKILADLIYNSKDKLKIRDIFIDFPQRLFDKSKMNSKVLILICIFFIKKYFIK
jgi:dolichol-phosphate mannosyltransferase